MLNNIRRMKVTRSGVEKNFYVSEFIFPDDVLAKRPETTQEELLEMQASLENGRDDFDLTDEKYGCSKRVSNNTYDDNPEIKVKDIN